MNINLKDINIQTRSLAARYIDAKHTGKDVIEVQSLESRERVAIISRTGKYTGLYAYCPFVLNSDL